MPMTFRQVIKALQKHGWILKTTKGSHHQYVHPDKPGKVTIPCHGGDIKTGTLRSIEKQSGIQLVKKG